MFILTLGTIDLNNSNKLKVHLFIFTALTTVTHTLPPLTPPSVEEDKELW